MHATRDKLRRPILTQVHSDRDQDAEPSAEPLPADAISLNVAVALSGSSKHSIKKWALQGKFPYWQRAADGRMQFSRADIVTVCCYLRGPVDMAAAAAISEGAQA